MPQVDSIEGASGFCIACKNGTRSNKSGYDSKSKLGDLREALIAYTNSYLRNH